MPDQRSVDSTAYRTSGPRAGVLPLLLLAFGLTASACGDDIVVVESLGLVYLMDRGPDDPDHHEHFTYINVDDVMHVMAGGNQCFGSSCNRLVSTTCTMEVIDEGTVELGVRTVVEHVRQSSGFLGLASDCTSDCARYPAYCGRLEIGAEEIIFLETGVEFGRMTFPRHISEARLDR